MLHCFIRLSNLLTIIHALLNIGFVKANTKKKKILKTASSPLLFKYEDLLTGYLLSGNYHDSKWMIVDYLKK